MDAAELDSLWETSLGRKEWPEGAKWSFQEGWERFPGWKRCGRASLSSKLCFNPWLSPSNISFSSFPGSHLLEFHLLLIIPEMNPLPKLQDGFGWSFPIVAPCQTKLCFHHFYFANFGGLFPSFFVPPPAAWVPHWVDFCCGEKKKSQKTNKKKRRKCHH